VLGEALGLPPRFTGQLASSRDIRGVRCSGRTRQNRRNWLDGRAPAGSVVDMRTAVNEVDSPPRSCLKQPRLNATYCGGLLCSY